MGKTQQRSARCRGSVLWSKWLSLTKSSTGVCGAFEGIYELSGFYDAYRLVSQVIIVVGDGVVYDFLEYIWCSGQSFQKEVDSFSAPYGISCEHCQVFELCYVFIDEGETQFVGFKFDSCLLLFGVV